MKDVNCALETLAGIITTLLTTQLNEVVQTETQSSCHVAFEEKESFQLLDKILACTKKAKLSFCRPFLTT